MLILDCAVEDEASIASFGGPKDKHLYIYHTSHFESPSTPAPSVGVESAVAQDGIESERTRIK